MEKIMRIAENKIKSIVLFALLQKIAVSQPDSLHTVIVQYFDEPTDSDYALLYQLDASISCELRLIYGLLVQIPASQIEVLSQSDTVKRISPDREVRACLTVASPSMGVNHYVRYFNLTGRGVTVAVLDSGIVSSDEFSGRTGNRIVASIDFVQDQQLAGYDYYGHGTHIAGIVGMKSHYDEAGHISYSGIAPEAFVASIRVLDSSGKGKVSTVVKGMEWCVDHIFSHRIRVINLSLSHPIYESFTTDPLTQACERAWESGLVVVAAAGNHGLDQNGYGTIGSPGNDPYILTVGSTGDMNTINKDDDTLPGFSSKGPALLDYILKPDILAPGSAVFSVRVPDSYLDLTHSDNRVSLEGASHIYFKLNGTSLSSAVVSGAAALMLEKEPFLSPSTIKARIMRSADKSFTANIYHRGAGYLNIEAALLDNGIAESSLSPKIFRTDSGIVLDNLHWDGPGLWEEQEIWGSHINWGENDIYDDLSLWGSNALNDYQDIWTSGTNEESAMTQ
jgi:serine protease AprX